MKMPNKEIKGVDPRSWGVFDRTVSWLSRGFRYLMPVAGAVAVVEAATACSYSQQPPAETAPLPSDEVISLGLFDQAGVEGLPDSEYKVWAKKQIDTLNYGCTKTPGCVENSVKFHSFVVEDKMVMFGFADFNDKADKAPYTKILSIVDDGGEQIINGELLAKSGKLNGQDVVQVGWVDKNGESHYVYKTDNLGNLSVYYQNKEYKIAKDTGNTEDKVDLLTKIMGFGVTPVSAEAGKTETPPPVSTNTPEATEAPVSILKVNPVPAEFLFDGVVEKAFNDGEYENGMRTIAEWVKIWEEMGVFEGEQFSDDSLNPVPLKGLGRVVCVDTRGQGKYAGMLLCIPIDTVNGGLRQVPTDGNWTEAGRPLVIKFEGTEELTTKGSGAKLVYQFQDKYQGYATRYIDPVTGEIVAGKTTVKDVEIEGNEVIEGSIVCVSNEYCMGGQMEVDPEVGKVFYEQFLKALLVSKVNQDYFENILGSNPTIEDLKTYLEENNGMLPAGLKMIRGDHAQYAQMDYVIDRPVNVSGLKTVVFGSKEWQNNIGNIQEFLSDYNDTGLINVFSGSDKGWIYFGWYLDENGYFVLVSGSKDPEEPGYDKFEIIGGKDGVYTEHDNWVATGYALSVVTFLKIHSGRHLDSINPLSEVGGSMGAYPEDIEELLGGKNLFRATSADK